MGLPRFDELPPVEGTRERSAWGVFGADDELGTVNLIDAAAVRAAAALVRTGQVVNLNLPLDFEIGMSGEARRPPTHQVEVTRAGREDHLDGLALQGTSQWDGLRHVRYRQHGYYGGRDEGDLEGDAIGIGRWAEHGMIGRGILVDAVRFFAERGEPIDPTTRVTVGAEELDAYLEWAGLETQPGDMLLLRTGWLGWLKALSLEERRALRERLHPNEGGLETPGLRSDQATAAWLWDHQIAAIAADNYTVEALRIQPEVGYQHHRLIALQGMPLGELWDLDALAEACASEDRYEFMLVTAPLYLPKGVASPANAYAIL